MRASPTRIVRHVLDGGVSSIAQARRLVEVFLAAAVPPVGENMIADGRLAVSELVTNAVRHAPGRCVLRLSDDGRCVQVAVSDSNARPPLVRHSDVQHGVGGAGLLLLHRLAGAVEVRVYPDGKTVSVRLSREPATQPG